MNKKTQNLLKPQLCLFFSESNLTTHWQSFKKEEKYLRF